MARYLATLFILLLFARCAKDAGRSALERERNAAEISEITLERIYDGCLDCPDHRVVLRRNGSDVYNDASVTYFDKHSNEERSGSISAYFYNNLAALLVLEGYFDMKDGYALGWEDTLRVTISVVRRGQRKTIKTASEGDVPIKLWAIYMAVDGVVAKAKWQEPKKSCVY